MEDASVSLYNNLSGETSVIDAGGDDSGHGGGDVLHAMLLKRMIEEPDFKPEQSAEAGYLSAVMCFAADLSMNERRRVDFTYDPDGWITLV